MSNDEYILLIQEVEDTLTELKTRLASNEVLIRKKYAENAVIRSKIKGFTDYKEQLNKEYEKRRN